MSTEETRQAQLPELLREILRLRRLEAADGRPLYGYRMTEREVAEVRQRLVGVIRQFGGSCLDAGPCAAAFVVVACDWVRRWSGGGQWGYAPLMQDLGLRYPEDVSWKQIADGIRAGLKYWGRNVTRNDSGHRDFLYSLIVEAGLPLGAIREGSSLAKWLVASLALTARGFDPKHAVEQEAWRGPGALAEKLTDVAAVLVACLDQARRFVPSPGERGGLDCVAWLDIKKSGWRDALPLDIDDGAARALIEDVVRRADRSASGDLSVERGLVWSGDGAWTFTISLRLDATIAHAELPDTIRTALEDRVRARLKPSGALLSRINADLAVLETRPDDEGTRCWRVRPLRLLANVAFPAGERVDLAVGTDGAALELLDLPGAEALSNEPMVFSVDPENPDSLVFVASGSHSTRAPRLALAVPREAVSSLQAEDGAIEQLGETTEFGLQIFLVKGAVSLSWDGQNFRWRVGAERDSTIRLDVRGPTDRSTVGLVRRHGIEVWVTENGIRTHGQGGERRWKPRHGGVWRSWPDAACRGDVTLCFERDGIAMARTAASIAPAGFSTAGTVSGAAKSLAISGLHGATISVGGSSMPLDEGVLRLDRRGALGVQIPLEVRWPDGTSWRVELLDKTARPGFSDANGLPLRQGWRGSVNALRGVFATSVEPRKVVLELRGSGPTRSVVRSLRGVTPLYALAPDIRAILGGADSFDTTVRLQWIGGGEQRIEVGLFDIDLHNAGGELTVDERHIDQLISEGVRELTIAASALADPVVEHILYEGPPSGLREGLTTPHKPVGPWLCYGRADGRFRIRPRVVQVTAADADGRSILMQRVLEGDFTTRVEDLKNILLSDDFGDEGAMDAKRLLAALQPRAPLQALDLCRALITTPEAAVKVLAACTADEVEKVLALENELDFVWCTTSVLAWREAFEERRRLWTITLASLGEKGASNFADATVKAVLDAIARHQPALAFHVLSCGGNPSDGWWVDPAHEVDRCVGRNADNDWPIGLGLAQRLGAGIPNSISGKMTQYHDILAAPHVAAQIAAGRIAADSTLVSVLRWARLFDTIYFDRVAPSALAPLAR